MIDQLIDMEIDNKSYAILKHTLYVDGPENGQIYYYSQDRLLNSIELILKESKDNSLQEPWLDHILENNFNQFKLSLYQHFMAASIFDSAIYFDIFMTATKEELISLIESRKSFDSNQALKEFYQIKGDCNTILKSFLLKEIGKNKIASLNEKKRKSLFQVLS